MSFAEILAEVETLNPEECKQLEERLRLRRRLQDPAFMAEMERRFDEAERGENLVPKAEVLERLRAAGRNV